METKYRVLLIYPGSGPPKPEAESNMEYHISRYCTGDHIATHWGKRSELPAGPIGNVYSNLSEFRYHATFSTHLSKLIKFFWDLFYFVRTGYGLSRTQGRYQAIVTYGPYTCAIAGWLIRFLTRARLIIMLPAPPIETFKFVGTRLGRFKYRVAKLFIPYLIRSADSAWLLYPTQLDQLPGGKPGRVHVFPDFTPTTQLTGITSDGPVTEPYVLFLGHPFHRKGVDLLIKAFRMISDKHPGVVLRVVGACPDLAPYREMAGDNPRIVFERPVDHREAMRLMAGCTLFVLPSRMEGVPRVVVEAMAMGKPVVASRINGTPYILQDGQDGLLFDSEDVAGLAEKMDRALGDPEYACRLGRSARERVLTELSTDRFVERFQDMIADVVHNRPARPTGSA